jgi:hypothetical protein
MVALAGALSGIAVQDGVAAGLTQRDYLFLEKAFGFSKNGFVLKNINAADTARLLRVMHDPVFAANAEMLQLNLATLLLDVERNTCHLWEQENHRSPCPEVSDPRVMPGWEIAEDRCIACHLTGTAMAPPFVKMAREKAVDSHFLTSALASGHSMSSISLSQDGLRDLADYINSLR